MKRQKFYSIKAGTLKNEKSFQALRHKNITLCILIVLLSILYGCSGNDNLTVSKDFKKPWHEYRFVAHGGGQINGVMSSNTEETFLESYNRGFKIQEVDVCYTADSACVLAHGWWDIAETMGLDHKPTYEEFMKVSYLGKYHNCNLSYIIDFMRNHKDTYIIVDGSHEVDPTLYTKQILEYSESDSNILDRLVFEVNTDEVYKIIDSLYHFKYYIYAGVNYKKVSIDENILFCKQHGIPAVSIGNSVLREDDIRKYNDNDIKVFAYTINDKVEMDSLFNLGVWGIYTDILDPAILP